MTDQRKPYTGTSADDMMRAGYPTFPDMSLRDYFAAKAMAALIAEPVNEGYSSSAWHWTDQLRMRTQMSGPDIIAHAAYMVADAMLKAREKA
ncbi:MAG TPA: hypothetical protein VIK69_09055 [Methylophilaceae bacterium]